MNGCETVNRSFLAHGQGHEEISEIICDLCPEILIHGSIVDINGKLQAVCDTCYDKLAKGETL